MKKIKNRQMITRPVMLARRDLWLLSLLLLLPFSVVPAAANTVSMVCNGLFDVERMRGEITETEQFDGSVYVTVELDGGDVSRVQMVPIERNRRMSSLDFIKNMPQPANGDLIDLPQAKMIYGSARFRNQARWFLPLMAMIPMLKRQPMHMK